MKNKKWLKDVSGRGQTNPGRDPWDPWSAKAGISEGPEGGNADPGIPYKADLPDTDGIAKNKVKMKKEVKEATAIDTFLKFHGYEPKFVSHEKRAAYGRSLKFKKWMKDRKLGNVKLLPDKQSEEVEYDSLEQLDELSNETLGAYKKAAGKAASAADKAGDFKKGNKRFAGVVKATKKQFANDVKLYKEDNGQDAVYGGDSGRSGESMNSDGPPAEPEKKNDWAKKANRFHTGPHKAKPYHFSDGRGQGKYKGPHKHVVPVRGHEKPINAKEEFEVGKDFQIHKKTADAAIKRVKQQINGAVNPAPKRQKNPVPEDNMPVDDPKGTITRVAEAKDKKELSKSARMIKALYKKHRMVKEELYDWEKDDKKPATTGKKPKFVVNNLNQGKDKANGIDGQEHTKGPEAAAVLTGGTTMTGQERDTIEIDPKMRQRPGQPDPTKKR